MSWIHDNEIKYYSVDLENNVINIYTEYKCNDFEEKTTIIFKNVVANEFSNIGSGSSSILYGINVDDIETFIQEYNDLLVERKKYGWPLNYGNMEELESELNKKKQNYYYLNAVCGMSGFVLAEKMIIEVNGEIKEEL